MNQNRELPLNMEKKWIIGIDQSTQGTKAVLIDDKARLQGKTYLPHEQLISPEGWVPWLP